MAGSNRSTLTSEIALSCSSLPSMRQLNTPRSSLKFKTKTSKLSARSRATVRRPQPPLRRRVSAPRRPPPLPTPTRLATTRRVARVRSRRLPPLARPPPRATRTASASSPLTARARRYRTVTLTRRCARFVVLS